MFNEHELFSDTILENENSGASFPGEYLDTYKGAGFLIGTAGLDMFKNRVLILDFKHNKLGYGNKLSDAFYTQKTRTSIFTFYKNRIIIPVEIGEAFYPFMYDCGASMFTLQTTPKKSISFKPLSYSDTLFDINNGETGQTHNVIGGKIGKPVKILNKVYKDIPVYIENSESEIFDEARVSGIIGNKLFLGNTIIIDFPNRKFTIIE